MKNLEKTKGFVYYFGSTGVPVGVHLHLEGKNNLYQINPSPLTKLITKEEIQRVKKEEDKKNFAKNVASFLKDFGYSRIEDVYFYHFLGAILDQEHPDSAPGISSLITSCLRKCSESHKKEDAPIYEDVKKYMEEKK